LRIIDLSAPITSGSPDEVPITIEYRGHEEGALEIEEAFGLPPRLLRDSEGWAVETLTMGTHSSTHVDAPYHYNSKIAGEPAARVDELPLERFLAPGVVIDATAREDGDALSVADVVKGIEKASHKLQPGHIVLVHTGCDAFYGCLDYPDRGPGVSASATRWLVDQGIVVMGIDAWGWDRPLKMEAADALKNDMRGIFWAAHQADLNYSQIERLCNLGSLPPTGFTVACFPLRIVGAGAAPARVVAILDD